MLYSGQSVLSRTYWGPEPTGARLRQDSVHALPGTGLRYEPVVRPAALLTAMLGYTFVVLGLLVDIGRSWAIWKPMF